MKKLTVLLLLFASACNSSLKEAHSVNQAIAYISDRNGFDIFYIDELGQWEKQVTFGSGSNWFPKWNKGLKQLVFYHQGSAGGFSVLSKNLSDKVENGLPFSELAAYQLSPDGRYVFYTKKSGQSKNIWVRNLKDSTDRKLTDSNGYNGRFAVSPDGNQLAFISDRTESNELYLLNVKSLELKQLTDNDRIEKYISWSPKGDQIAFTMRENSSHSKEDIYIINIDGSGLVQVTDTPYAEQEIAWSLDGKKIAFHGTTENDGDQIYTITVDGKQFTKVTSGEFYHGEPTWVEVPEGF